MVYVHTILRDVAGLFKVGRLVAYHHPDDIGGVVRQKAVPLLTDLQQLVVLFAGGQRLRQTSVDTVNVERDGTDDREQQARNVEPCQITL